ncbi:MAG: divergent polysaccharide deacetylase family protein [FCB group bacterium]|nr:divergent polysaccharide deacetylase family protein [FCB group bacterium]
MPKATRYTGWKLATGILSGIVIVLVGLLIRNYYQFKPAEKPEPVIVQERPLQPSIVGDIVLIIDDFGYRNDEVTDGFLALDAPMTYAVIPGHRYSRSFGQAADEQGYEVIIHMPMETRAHVKGENDFRLLTTMSKPEIINRLKKAFDELPMAAGMNNHQGSKGTENARLMGIVASFLNSRGAYFVDSRTSAQSVAVDVMHANMVPADQRAVFLDNDSDPDLIRVQLNELKAKSKSSGFAIGIGHARPNTLRVLKAEIPRIREEGYRLLYASQGMG